MFFSVIIPIYKAEKHLHQCIKSVLEQSFTDFELILVDDGSPDSSGQICDDYAKSDSRIKVIHKSNGGVVSARKAGIMNSVGEYIVSVDSDDYISNNLLETLFNVIDEHKCDMVAFNGIAFNSSTEYNFGNSIAPGIYKESMDELKSNFMYEKNRGTLNFGNLLFSLWSKAIRRDMMLTYQYQVPDNISKGDDLAVLAPIIYNCSSIAVIEGDYYYYRINDESIMHSFSEKNLYSNVTLWDYLAQYCGDKYRENLNMCAVNMLCEHITGIVNQSDSYKAFMKQVKNIYTEDIMKYIANVYCQGLHFLDKIKLYGLKKNPGLLYLLYKFKSKTT